MTLPTPDTNSDASGEIPLPPGLFREREVESPEITPTTGERVERPSRSRRSRRRSSSSSRTRTQRDDNFNVDGESGAPQRMRRRVKKDDGEFDPTRHTGERNVRSFMGDVGYFAQQQIQEIKNVLRRARRLSRDMIDEVLSKLRK
ncbi:MAG: hypothetical protein AAGG44_04800 [Planctomycetota bacterium]